jgi:SAM-dependent methyltransferase
MHSDIVSYYRRRLGEYERVYAKPERQTDLARLRKIAKDYFRNQQVLEISCGTGYWTEAFALTARAVLACDVSPEALEIARGKQWGAACVEFVQADSYALPIFDRHFSAAFSGFWWSHIPKRGRVAFLSSLHAKLGRSSRVMFIDSRYVEGSSTPLFRVSPEGDSFQQRHLEDGSVHEVMKNFPLESELLQVVAGMASSPEVVLTDFFWILTYKTL